MKEQNAVQALNRVISEWFEVPCEFESFVSTVKVEEYRCYSHLTFRAFAPIVTVPSGCFFHLIWEQTLSGMRVCDKYLMVLPLESELRKQILNEMLKHNGG